MKGIKMDFAANTITITADFAKKMCDPTTEEYKTVVQVRNDFPEMKIIRKTHASPKKCVSKSTGETFNCNQFKNLKYENMEGFIKGLPNNEEHLKAYNFLKNCGGLPQTSRYTAVRKWFVAQFPEFRKNPLFYLYNEVKVVNIAPFIQEAQERAEELAAKKAEEENEGQKASGF